MVEVFIARRGLSVLGWDCGLCLVECSYQKSLTLQVVISSGSSELLLQNAQLSVCFLQLFLQHAHSWGRRGNSQHSHACGGKDEPEEAGMARRAAALLTFLSGSVCGVCGTLDLFLYSHHVPGQRGYFQDCGGKGSKQVTLKSTCLLVMMKNNLRSTLFLYQ